MHHGQRTAPGERKSIFARHIAAQKAMTGCEVNNKSKVSNTQPSEFRHEQGWYLSCFLSVESFGTKLYDTFAFIVINTYDEL